MIFPDSKDPNRVPKMPLNPDPTHADYRFCLKKHESALRQVKSEARMALFLLQCYY